MATDIAFALGVLALLGDRVPLSLKVFLAAVAIADDIGAVMVIALFYTSHISVLLLGLAGVMLAVALAGNMLGVRRPLFYALVGLAVWFCFLKSGIHSTVAGVAMAMIIPAKTRCDTDLFLFNSTNLIDEFKRHHHPGSNVLTNHGQLAAIQSMQNVANKAQTPLQHLEHALVPWVDFVIMPLFALATPGCICRRTSARRCWSR
nr:Na+/H+ antiporter NhaA [Salidesulfovibrio brasiliensis]